MVSFESWSDYPVLESFLNLLACQYPCFFVSCPNLCPFFFFFSICFPVSVFQCLLCFESVSWACFIMSIARLIAALASYFSVHPWRASVFVSDHLWSCVPLSPCLFPCRVFYLNLCSCSCSAAQQLGTVSPLDSPTLLVATLQS